MKTADIKVLMENIAPVLKDFVGQTFAPISTRLDAIEKRFNEMPIPTNGKDADADAISNVVMLRLKPEVEGLAKIITQEIPAEIAKAVEKLPVPKDGSSVSVDDVAPIIIAEVAKRFEALPVPKDGTTPTEADIEPIVARAVAAIPKAKDGVGVAGAIIDRDGNLVLTTTDGAQKELGKVVGKDGIDAEVSLANSEEFATAPDDVAMTISKAIRLMAETPEIVSREAENGNGGGVNIHLPNVIVPDVVIPEIKLPEIKMPPVSVTVVQPKKRNTRTTVKEHDSRGRVLKFEQEEID